MPLIGPVKDPCSKEVYPNTWTYCRLLPMDFGSQTMHLVFETYKDKESAYTGYPPLETTAYEISPTGKPAVYGPTVLISEGVPAVYETTGVREPGTNGPDDPGGAILTMTVPAVDPVYSEPELLEPAIPSFAELVAQNAEAYALLQSAVDEFALTRPKFAGCVVEV